MKPEIIIEESQRESIINRPHNLAGSVQRVLKERYNITPTSVEFSETNIVPAVLKLFQESLDNPIDVAIKSNFKSGNKVEIKVDNNSITIKDNGYGISSAQDENGEYVLFKAMCKYNTSSNYTSDNQGQKGVNGIGIKLCTTLSTEFTAISDDGKKQITVKATDNNLNHTVKEEASKRTGTTISFKPDFKIFEIDEIDQAHINRMFEYTLIQALTYPDIEFKFNGKKVNYTNKKFLSLFNKTHELFQTDDYFFAIMPNETDDFKQISFVNGLETQRGGSHIDYIMNNLVSELREKVQKKYKNIKPADFKNKMQLIIIAKNFKGLKWDGQTKESITNPQKDMAAYFEGIEFDKLAQKILKNEDIIDPITEVYKIKEELKKRQELKGLQKPTKKIKSEKYLPPIGQKKYLFLTEGESATGGLLPVLGRKNCGYYELRGKPLNAYSAPQSKFTANKELSELFKIINNENYDYVVFANDADLDGVHIAGLLIGFFQRYMPEMKGKIGKLSTPVKFSRKNGKPKEWVYSINGKLNIKPGEEFKYMKGLGSWVKKDLQYIIEKDGLEKMIDLLEFDDDNIIDDWMGDDSTPRKKYIVKNEFSIAKL